MEINGQAISITGSNLLEKITATNQTGKFKILPEYRKPAIQKMSLMDLQTKAQYSLDDIRGNIIKGQQTFTFNGTTFNDLFEITYRMNLPKEGGEPVQSEEEVETFQLMINIHFEKWNNIEVNVLPYFDRIYQFFRHLLEGWEFETTLEIDGDSQILGGGINLCDQDTIKRYYAWLRYIFLVRKLLKYIEESVQFNAQFTFSNEDYDKLTEIYNVISMNNVQDIKGSMETSLIVAEDLNNVHLIEQWGEPTSIMSIPKEQEPLKIFEKDVLLPKIYRSLTKVKPEIKTALTDIKPGQEILVRWIPEKDCKYVFGFTKEE